MWISYFNSSFDQLIRLPTRYPRVPLGRGFMYSHTNILYIVIIVFWYISSSIPFFLLHSWYGCIVYVTRTTGAVKLIEQFENKQEWLWIKMQQPTVDRWSECFSLFDFWLTDSFKYSGQYYYPTILLRPSSHVSWSTLSSDTQRDMRTIST